MIFSLEVLRARKGDCLLLHAGTAAAPLLAVIDGGPKNVYKPHLKPRLQQLAAARKLAGKPLPVDLLMVSHVDDDHIQGILELTAELRAADEAGANGLVRIDSLWHNSFDNLIGGTPKELTAAMTAQFGAASLAGDPPTDLHVESAEHHEVVCAALKVLASIPQGAQLRTDAGKLDVIPNDDFGGKLIMAKANAKPFKLTDDLAFTFAGPMEKELQDLHKKHQEWLKELDKKGKSPEDVLSAYVDKSVPNLSSIVTLVTSGAKSILLTGDARGDKILEGLELVGLLKPKGTLAVDVLKVPHHGSSNNLETGFFTRITAKHYVFSGDGEHGNPERESLEMLLAARGDTGYEVHLTYPVDAIDAERKKDWEKERAKELKRKSKHIREEWSPKKHGLAALLADHPAFAKSVSVVDDKSPHVIDLGDKFPH